MIMLRVIDSIGRANGNGLLPYSMIDPREEIIGASRLKGNPCPILSAFL